MALGSLELELSLNGNSFNVELKKAEGALGRFILGANNANNAINRLERSTSSWGRVLRDLVITTALIRDAFRTLSLVTVDWQKAIATTNGEIQRSLQLMKSFSKEIDPVIATQEAIADVQMLLDKASRAPFSLQSITDSFTKLRVGGIENTTESFNALVDAVSAFGGSDQNLKRASVALQQMSGKGVVSLEELRQQLGEAVPKAIEMMADGLGTTYSKLVKEISQGKVLAEPAIMAMMREFELSFRGSAERMMNTWGGTVAQFETEFTRLQMIFGGFDSQNGPYGDGTYMKAITDELKELTQLMRDPSIQQSIRDLGAGMAEIVRTISDGIQWFVKYREEITRLAQALLTLWAVFKGASIMKSVAQGGFGMIFAAATKGGSAISALRSEMTNASVAFQRMNAQAADHVSAMRAAGGATGVAARALGALGGAVAMLTGPWGALISMVAAGAAAFWGYKRSVDASIDSMIQMRGVGASMDQLEKAQERLTDNTEKIKKLQAENQKLAGDGFLLMVTSSREDAIRLNNVRIQEMERENEKLGESIEGANRSIADRAATALFDGYVAQVKNGLEKATKEYTLGMEEYRKKVAQAEKSGDKGMMAQLTEEKTRLERERMDSEYQAYEAKLGEMQTRLAELGRQETESLSRQAQQQVAQEKANLEKAVTMMRTELGRVDDDRLRLAQTARTFDQTLISGAGQSGKQVFDPLNNYISQLRVNLAKTTAKIEEANPHLAALYATIENMGDKKGPNFDAQVAEGKKLAEQLWAQEKARKALTEANSSYTDTMERLRQIDMVAITKLSKADNENPWLKASADAERYRVELGDLTKELEKAREVGQKSGDSDLVKNIDAATASFDKLNAKFDQISMKAATKLFNEGARDIALGLGSETERLTADFQYQMGLLDEYYAKNKDLLATSGEDLRAFQEYRKQLEEQFLNDTSGLNQWINANKDASDKYRSLWQSSMDGFVDTLAGGLTSGKLEISSFVEFVLQEMLKIQLAKQAAMMASSLSGAGGWFGSLFGGSSSGGGQTQAESQGLFVDYSFANGGIMTKSGRMALKKYANGGIADRPQIALYGEGSMPEAYVPLPDGRTIPVTLTSTSQGQTQTSTPAAGGVEVNLYNQGGDQMSAEANSRFDGEKFVVDVVLRNISRPGPVRDAVKGVR